MTPLIALLVDDEPLARAELARMLTVDPRVSITAEAGSADEATRAIREAETLGRPIDLMFLDMEMPGTPALPWLETLVAAPNTVIVTAYPDYALPAFRVAPLDYLLKPVRRDDLARAVGRAWQRKLATSQPLKRMLIRDGSRWHWLDVGQIRRLTAEGNFTRIHCGPLCPLVARTLSGLESQLPFSDFIRVSRSDIIGLDHVAGFEDGPHGRLVVHLASGEEVEIAQRRVKSVRRRLEI